MKSFQAVKQQEFIKPGEGSNININSIKKKPYSRWNHRETGRGTKLFKTVQEGRELILSSFSVHSHKLRAQL